MKLFEILSSGPSQAFMELVASTYGGEPTNRLFRTGDSVNIELKPFPPDEVYMAEIYTRPDKRGFGAASKILAELCSMADQTGCVLSLLPSGDDTPGLRRWYAKYGFTGERKMIRPPR